jgi:hypothetical protein
LETLEKAGTAPCNGLTCTAGRSRTGVPELREKGELFPSGCAKEEVKTSLQQSYLEQQKNCLQQFSLLKWCFPPEG